MEPIKSANLDLYWEGGASSIPAPGRTDYPSKGMVDTLKEAITSSPFQQWKYYQEARIARNLHRRMNGPKMPVKFPDFDRVVLVSELDLKPSPERALVRLSRLLKDPIIRAA